MNERRAPPRGGSEDAAASSGDAAEVLRLGAELEAAEAYEQRLRQCIVDVRHALRDGHVPRALSMLNEVLREIDDQADVVAKHPGGDAPD